MIKIDTIRHKLIEAIKYSGKQQKDIANLIGITPQALYNFGKAFNYYARTLPSRKNKIKVELFGRKI